MTTTQGFLRVPLARQNGSERQDMSSIDRGERCRIHLVRHGRTVMNAQVRFRGRRDVPLDEVGQAEALEAARSLAHQKLSTVYSSPLQRARDVGEAIAAAQAID